MIDSPNSNLSSDVINSNLNSNNYNQNQFDSDPAKHFDIIYQNNSPKSAKEE